MLAALVAFSGSGSSLVASIFRLFTLIRRCLPDTKDLSIPFIKGRSIVSDLKCCFVIRHAESRPVRGRTRIIQVLLSGSKKAVEFFFGLSKALVVLTKEDKCHSFNLKISALVP